MPASGLILWKPSAEEIVATLARASTPIIERLGSRQAMADALGISDNALAAYLAAGDSRRWNALRLMRYLVDESPYSAALIAPLVGIELSEGDQDQKRRRRVALLLRAFDSDDPAVRAQLVALELQLGADA